MNDVLVRANVATPRTCTHQSLLWLILSICIFLSGTIRVSAKEVQQSGDICNTKNKVLSPFVCVEGFVVDCRKSSDSRELLYCVASELQRADAELNRLYQGILKKFMKTNDEDTDYKAVQKSFIEGQRAWLKFKKLDCEVLGHLNLKGSTQSSEIVSCELKHTKKRVVDLGYFLITLR